MVTSSRRTKRVWVIANQWRGPERRQRLRGHRSSRPFRATAILPCPVFPPRRPFLAPLSRRADASTAPSTVARTHPKHTNVGAVRARCAPGTLWPRAPERAGLLETAAHPPHRANPVSVHHELRRSPKRQHPGQRPAHTGPAHLW